MAGEIITASGTLEENSLWLKYATEVFPQPTEQAVEINNIIRAIRCVHNFGDLAYISAPITSGKVLYDLQLENPSMSQEERLRLAMTYNYQHGLELVTTLQKSKRCPILYPADMVPVKKDWKQAHFQALWLSLIAEKCTEVHMGKGWEYSNGATEEFTHVMQLRLGIPKHSDIVFLNTKEDEQQERERMRNIRVYDDLGNPLSIDGGIGLMAESIGWVQKNGLDGSNLVHCLKILKWTRQMTKAGFYQK